MMSKHEQERAEILLRAAHELLRNIELSVHEDALTETAFYDGSDCDGYCLIDDIAGLLDIDD